MTDAAGGELTYRTVIGRALADEMAADPSVVLVGADLGASDDAFAATPELHERFASRIRETPIAEQSIVGMAAGAAALGIRPVAQVMSADFAAVNALASYRYMTGGQLSVPVTIRMVNGAGCGLGPQLSQPAENWFLNVPGVKLVAPGTVADLYGLLRSAVQDDDPVIVFEHANLSGLKGTVGTEVAQVPIGVADVVRTGTDVTVVALQQMRHRAVEAAQFLERTGVSVAVIDLRTIAPLDTETVVASLRATSRLVVVQEGGAPGSWGASLIALLVSEHFELLDAPPTLVCSDHTPVPYGAAMEAAWLPDAARITDAVNSVMRY
jgi:pyruvate/2-oxoglutarate/acetoin dehydrogenase E1 component